ncbi:lipoate--protein ligase [Lawsonibacter celer]|jgi:lipoate-protein ligase A|uniref:lipoate--protein ligase n=1 Tax=Lawsonibacter celer TaxID=2986526 RepID=UPI0016480022|nr:lipoate--protein ligase [Lawsonibacter celer]
MYYIESQQLDPEWNLALEQYVFDRLGPREDCFMLWQNDRAVIVGKHQNTVEEVNAGYVKEHGVKVVRRLSGGGAVYHDLGNINFTFVSGYEGSSFDFASFCRPVVEALHSIGVPAEINGRNDMTIEGKKFSGNAQYMKHGHVMHHGTLMFHSDLEAIGQALAVKTDKIESKGLKSVRSRVTNIKPYAPEGMTTRAFWSILRDHMFRAYDLKPYILTDGELAEVDHLRREVYSTWEWNYGASPACRIVKRRRIEGVGGLEIHMDLENGRLSGLCFYGDYFGNGDSSRLAARLMGQPLDAQALRPVLAAADVGQYFAGITAEQLLDALLC